MLTDPDEILDRAITQFMAQMAGRFDPDAPVADRWAQAVTAFVEPGTDTLERGHADALRTWIGPDGGEQDQRDRLIALTVLCSTFPGMTAGDAAAVRAEPARLIALSEFWLHLSDQLGDDQP